MGCTFQLPPYAEGDLSAPRVPRRLLESEYAVKIRTDLAEMILAALGIVSFIGAAVFFAWERHQMCLAEIEGSRRKPRDRYRNRIRLDDYDRDTFTYDVQYRDSSGKFHRNRCKVTSGRAIDDEAVYWVDPIGPPRA